MRGRSSDRSARSRSVHRSTGRPVGSPQRLVAAQSLVEYVRLAALCGLLRCEIAEDPKGNRRRRSMRRMPRELASGSSEKWRRPVSTGVSIPGSGPAAEHDDRSGGGPSQYILRTIWRTNSTDSVGSFRQCHRTQRVATLSWRSCGSAHHRARRACSSANTASLDASRGNRPPVPGARTRLMRTKPVEDDGHSWR
jgi:hypothetical protein